MILRSLIVLANKLDRLHLTAEAEIVDAAVKSTKDLVDDLNSILSDEYVLYTKLRNYHWNVEGPFFSDLHKFFEQQYGLVAQIADDVAERVRSIGGFALGTMTEFLQNSSVKEFADLRLSHDMMLADLERTYGIIISKLRNLIKKYNDDVVAQDFLTTIVLSHEKTLWMVTSLLN